MVGNYAVSASYTFAVKFPSDSNVPDWKQILVFFSSEFYVCPHLSFRVLFITTITLAVSNDDGSN